MNVTTTKLQLNIEDFTAQGATVVLKVYNNGTISSSSTYRQC